MRMKYLAPDIVASLLPACSHCKLHLVVLIQGRDKAYWYDVQHLLISFLTKDSVSKYRLSMELHLSGERWDTFRRAVREQGREHHHAAGENGRSTSVFLWSLSWSLQLLLIHICVDLAFWHVRCSLASPTTLMRLSLLWKVTLFKVKEPLGSTG